VAAAAALALAVFLGRPDTPENPNPDNALDVLIAAVEEADWAEAETVARLRWELDEIESGLDPAARGQVFELSVEDESGDRNDSIGCRQSVRAAPVQNA
jgi:hypothetical protein